jgi:hypothetical protein
MNKRGFLRIVEASVAIVIVAGVLFLFFTQGNVVEQPDFSERARDILEEISKNPVLRESILAHSGDGVPVDVNNFIAPRIPENYLEFEAKICEVDSACGITYHETNVWSAERVISSTIDIPGPKKIRLFIWEVE